VGPADRLKTYAMGTEESSAEAKPVTLWTWILD